MLFSSAFTFFLKRIFRALIDYLHIFYQNNVFKGLFFKTNSFFGSLLFLGCVFFETILLKKTADFGAFQNLPSKAKGLGFRNFERF